MTREKLHRKLIRGGHLKTPRIIKAFKEIDRKNFLPEDLHDAAYFDQALPIGHGQTISQPLVVAFMLELLDPQPGEKILDVGTGSGWVATLIAHCVSNPRNYADKTRKNAEKVQRKSALSPRESAGHVVTIERVKELTKIGKENMDKYNLIKSGAIIHKTKDGAKGWRTHAPYDKIIASAASTKIPEAWKQQIKTGGNIVAPVNDSIIHLTKTSTKAFERNEHFGFSFVPLISDG